MGIKLGSVVCISLVLTAAPLEQVKPNCRRNNQEAQSLTLKVLYSMWKNPKNQNKVLQAFNRKLRQRNSKKYSLVENTKQVIQTEKPSLNVFKKHNRRQENL